MVRARILIVVVGVLLPYLARLPGGLEWLGQYTRTGVGGWLLLNGFNAIAWGSLVGISFLYRRPAWLLVPALLGFGYMAWAHFSLDLAADAQAALGIVFIPVYALVPIVGGGVVGFVLDRRMTSAAG